MNELTHNSLLFFHSFPVESTESCSSADLNFTDIYPNLRDTSPFLDSTGLFATLVLKLLAWAEKAAVLAGLGPP